jgi:hypothetical protein
MLSINKINRHENKILFPTPKKYFVLFNLQRQRWRTPSSKLNKP